MQPAELLALSDNPGNWRPNNTKPNFRFRTVCSWNVTVDQAWPDDRLSNLAGPDSRDC